MVDEIAFINQYMLFPDTAFSIELGKKYFQ